MASGFKVGGSEVAIKTGDVHGRGVYTARIAWKGHQVAFSSILRHSGAYSDESW